MPTAEELLEQARAEREQQKKETYKNVGKTIGHVIGTVGVWFIRPAFILWGMHILQSKGVPIPDFTYWEVFLLRYALGCIYPTYSKPIDK